MSRIPKALFVALAVALGCATVLLHGFLQRCFSISMKSHSVPTSEPTNIVETTAAMDGSSEPPSKEEVERLFSQTELVRNFRVPGHFRFVPGNGLSKILFPKSSLDVAPENEADADWVLFLDNTTGEIVSKSDDFWTPMENREIIELGLEDIKDESTKNHLRSLKTDVYQIPGLAVVTFREKDPIEDGLVLSPPFILRVWINTKNRSVFCGEIGN